MEGENLVFGEDCIIKLQDLGQLKDYSQAMSLLRKSLQLVASGESQDVPVQLWQVIEADPQDTYFLPEFPSILQLMLSIPWKQLLSKEHLIKIINFYFTIVEESLLSDTFGYEMLDSFTKEIAEFQKIGFSIHKQLLKLLYNLSSKVSYIEEMGKVVIFWDLLHEQQLFGSFGEGDRSKMGAVYAQCCEKFLRNREFRQLLSQNNNKPFLLLKKSLWEKNKAKFLEHKESLCSMKFYQSSFLKQMCQLLNKQFDDL